jgi:hypothetical protein
MVKKLNVLHAIVEKKNTSNSIFGGGKQFFLKETLTQ